MPVTYPTPETEASGRTALLEQEESRWNVIIFDDDEHSYAYVVEMMMVLFGMTPEEGFNIAYEVDHVGQAVVKTCGHEEAIEAHRRIISYGPDVRMAKSSGSMGCVIERAD